MRAGCGCVASSNASSRPKVGDPLVAATNVEVWQRGIVRESREIAAGIRRIVLEQESPMRAAPGTHIDLWVNVDGEPVRRSYSVVSTSEDDRLLSLSVLLVPNSRGGSIAMHALNVGDEVRMTQPLQNFPLRVGAEKYVLVAGGIGVTAIVNMARVLKSLNADYRFLYAGRTREAMAYLDELQQLHGDRLEVYVDAENSFIPVEALVNSLDVSTELYMCGPIRLMDFVRRTWLASHLDYPNLRYETFGNSGWFDPEEFIVRVPSLGIETLVGAGQTMLEALEDAGAELMYDCRKGECGLCEVRILALEGAIDHRDVFYSEHQHNDAVKMSCCVSRAVTSATGSRADAPPGAALAVVTIEV
jgi:ferredoxin-NADP reductase